MDTPATADWRIGWVGHPQRRNEPGIQRSHSNRRPRSGLRVPLRARLQHKGARTKRSSVEKGLLSLCLQRFLNTTGGAFRRLGDSDFSPGDEVFVLKWRLLERAIAILSGDHFSWVNVLYSDTAALLGRDLQATQRLCDMFNAQIAPTFGVQPSHRKKSRTICKPPPSGRPM